MSRSIAVIGASTNRQKYGNKCVRAYAAAGYAVYPVHPRAKEIEGHPAWPTVNDVPAAELDLISIYLPPDTCLQVLPELAKKPRAKCGSIPSPDHPAVLAQARSLGLNVVTGCSIISVESQSS